MRNWLPIVLLSAAPLFAADLPPGFKMTPGYEEVPSYHSYVQFDTRTIEDLGTGGRLQGQKLEGRVWVMNIRPTGQQKAGELQLADHEASLRNDGWTIIRDHGELEAKKRVGATTAWYQSFPNSSKVTILEEAPPPRVLTLTPPASTPETPADHGDYPYAAPFPGGSLQKTEHASRNLEVKPRNASQPLVFHVAETKWYAIPKDVSPYEFVTAYDRALEKSGWSVERDAIGSDGVVWAHYAKNGRDLWLYTRAQGGQQSINVVDVGADSAAARLKQELAAAGHVALYGIYFDTDSATPKPESETTLQHVLQVMTGDGSLHLEVQGHTDDSGSPEHNAKLSGDRAASVKAWLTAHGIAAARLTSKGYGATKPVADNHTPEGKAKNRRVELARIQ
jgi:outer membrane protein OmpA-like peptidoglycan-associated protein